MKTCITIWKLETTAKDNFVYVSLLKQQGNSDFEFISVSFFYRYDRLYTLLTYSFFLKSYDLKTESFGFLLVAVST